MIRGDRPAHTTEEIEITPAMTAAGAKEITLAVTDLYRNLDCEPEDLARRVFESMRKAGLDNRVEVDRQLVE